MYYFGTDQSSFALLEFICNFFPLQADSSVGMLFRNAFFVENIRLLLLIGLFILRVHCIILSNGKFTESVNCMIVCMASLL